MWNRVKGPSYDKVKHWYSLQEVNQLHARPKRAKRFTSIVAWGPADSFQMDKIVYGDKDAFHSYRSILVVVDVYSRFAEA